MPRKFTAHLLCDRESHTPACPARLVGRLLLLFLVLSCGCVEHSRAPLEAAPVGNVRPICVEDLTGRACNPLAESQDGVTVLVFVRKDCPISNRYAPTLRRLNETFAAEGVNFYLVYPNPSTTAEEIREHLGEYDYGIEALRDPGHVLVELSGATVTPEAAVFGRDDELVYRGRIDNRYVDFGQTRAQPTTHDLKAAIQAILANEPVPTRVTEAVGCFIADLK